MKGSVCRIVIVILEPSDTPCAIEETGSGKSFTRLADRDRRDERPVSRGVRLYESLERLRDLMDRARRSQAQRVGQLLVRDPEPQASRIDEMLP